MTATHCLVAFIVGMGVFDQVAVLRLKLSCSPNSKLHVYWLLMAWLWTATIAAVLMQGPQALWYANLDSSDERFVPGALLTGLIAAVAFAALLMPLVLMLRKPATASKLSFALDRLRFFLPSNSRERFWWALLSITAGICEETLFRSFLFQYFRSDPWQMGFAGAIALACLFFALGHLYQGVKAAVGTAVIAIICFALFLGSGNLLLPMVLHAAADVRILFFMRLADAPRKS
jgi:uncharacterized protein